jgi:hypothetical protein
VIRLERLLLVIRERVLEKASLNASFPILRQARKTVPEIN